MRSVSCWGSVCHSVGIKVVLWIRMDVSVRQQVCVDGVGAHKRDAQYCGWFDFGGIRDVTNVGSSTQFFFLSVFGMEYCFGLNWWLEILVGEF